LQGTDPGQVVVVSDDVVIETAPPDKETPPDTTDPLQVIGAGLPVRETRPCVARGRWRVRKKRSGSLSRGRVLFVEGPTQGVRGDVLTDPGQVVVVSNDVVIETTLPERRAGGAAKGVDQPRRG